MELSTKPHLEVNVRWMTSRDLQEVLKIEADCFDTPWDETEFLERIRRQNSVGMVADAQGEVFGFMIYELKGRKMILLSFAVAPRHRREGVGTQMIETLQRKLSQQNRTSIGVNVRETNLQAQCFFRELGFKATSVLRSYFEDTREDAYAMQFEILEHPSAES